MGGFLSEGERDVKQIDAILSGLSRAGAVFAALCVAVTALAYVAEVVARYGLAHPLNWASDIGSYMLCAGVFAALPLIARNRGHVSISIAVDLMSGRTRQRYVRLLELVLALVLAVVVWFVAKICMAQYASGVLTPMANQIPRWWLTLVMTIGLGLSALNMLMPTHGPAPVVEV